MSASLRVVGVAVLALSACGRIGFDAEAIGGDGALDRDGAIAALDARVMRDAGGSPNVDAGEFDAARPDAGDVDGGLDPCAGTLFCDDFEVAMSPRWIVYAGTGLETLRVTTPTRNGSAGAMKVYADIGGEHTSGAIVEVFTTEVERWTRAYYRIPTGTDFAEIELPFLTNDAYEQAAVLYQRGGGLNLHTHGWPSDASEDFAGVLPLDTWFCIEGHVRIGETDGLVELYLDGALMASRTNFDTRVLPRGSGAVMAGFEWRDIAASHTLFIDDVAAGETRIGCD